MVQSHAFKCSFDYAKRSCHAVNGIFANKRGSFASEKVVLQLVGRKCEPALFYIVFKKNTHSYYWL